MGSRSAKTVKALEERAATLARLRGTLEELQERVPSLPKMPKLPGTAAVPRFASSGSAAGLALWVGRRVLKHRSKKKKKDVKRDRKAAPAAPTVSVKVFPSGTAVALVAAAAIWAGVKVFEMQRRGPRGSGSVSPLRKGA